jgi:hypothetical protein
VRIVRPQASSERDEADFERFSSLIARGEATTADEAAQAAPAQPTAHTIHLMRANKTHAHQKKDTRAHAADKASRARSHTPRPGTPTPTPRAPLEYLLSTP